MNGRGRIHVVENPTPHRSKCRFCGKLITEPYRIIISGKDIKYYYHVDCIRNTVDVADSLLGGWKWGQTKNT